jgi:3-oxoacyl-[acyl-carrier protein] reductase
MSELNYGLKDRVVLVTGASRNIGRAIACAMASEGAHVVIHAASNKEGAMETARMVEKRGVSSLVTMGDLGLPETAPGVIKQIVDKFDRLDVLVNNAAIRPECAFSEMSYSDWRDVLSVCLDAVFLITSASLPYLQASDQACIINIGGLTGHTGALNRAHVITAKAGITGFTRALAHELSPGGINVNCVVPGLIDTIRGGTSQAEPQHHAKTTNILKRRGTPEEVADTVTFLAGNQARYITGQTIHVNGGAFLA